MLVVQNMMDDLREGRITQIELAELLEKDLAHKYQASRTTVRDARNQVMLNSTSDK
jgi:DNA-binding GntR family transcriptional regulator